MDRELKDQMRLAKRAATTSKERLVSALWWGGFLLTVAALLGYIFWDIFRPLAGTKFPELQRTHVSEGEDPQYNSNPPTSGPHYENPEEWGIYDKPLVMERLVHNLEHGGILIYYKCDPAEQSCKDMIAQLTEITKLLQKRDRKVILSPLETLDAPIVLAAWEWRDTMDSVDEARIFRFFKDHINRAPEKVL